MPEPYKIWQLDVGQGDCTIITFGSQLIVIDCGRKSAGKFALERFSNFMNDNTVSSRITHLILTHDDNDHCGGAEHFIDKKNKNIEIYTGLFFEKKINTYSYKINEIEYKTKEIIKEEDVALVSLGYNSLQSNSNENSPCLIIYSKSSAAIFLGDMTVTETIVNKIIKFLKEKWESDFNGKIIHVMLPHHGSFYSYNEDLARLQKLGATVYGVISCGGTEYDHPHVETVADACKYMSRLYVTNQYKYHAMDDGMIKVVISGTTDIYADMMFIPDEGTVWICGANSAKEPVLVKRSVKAFPTKNPKSLIRSSSTQQASRQRTDAAKGEQLPFNPTIRDPKIELDANALTLSSLETKLSELMKNENGPIDFGKITSITGYMKDHLKDYLDVKIERKRTAGIAIDMITLIKNAFEVIAKKECTEKDEITYIISKDECDRVKAHVLNEAKGIFSDNEKHLESIFDEALKRDIKLKLIKKEGVNSRIQPFRKCK